MVTFEERAAMREEVAKHLGIQLYAQYRVPQVAHLFKADETTIKRWCAKNQIPHRRYGGNNISFPGVMLCDFYLFGSKAVELWGDIPSDPSDLVSITLAKETVR